MIPLHKIFPTYQDWLDNLAIMRSHEAAGTGPNVDAWLAKYRPSPDIEVETLPGYVKPLRAQPNQAIL